MVSLTQGLSWAAIAVAVLIYLAAVAGVLADAATPPLDVGATSVLVTGLLFGGLGLALARQPARAA